MSITVVGDRSSLGCVCITLPGRGQDYDEPVSVLAAVVRELGGETFIVRDGDWSALAADVAILFGKCTAFDASARLLRDHATRRCADRGRKRRVTMGALRDRPRFLLHRCFLAWFNPG